MNLQTFLARLLSDRQLRNRYLAAPAAVQRAHGLDRSAADALASMDAPARQRQAETLLAKRYSEITAALPETCRKIGPHCRCLFDDFAEYAWPQGHDRHRRDAIAYLEYLTGQGVDISTAERRRLRFQDSARALQIGWRHTQTRYGLRNGLQLLYRFRGRQHESFIFLCQLPRKKPALLLTLPKHSRIIRALYAYHDTQQAIALLPTT